MDNQGKNDMNGLLVPCGLLLFAVGVGFFLCLYFVRSWYFVPLSRRIRQLERHVIPVGRSTDDVLVQTIAPRPTRPSRYVSVDRQPKPEYYR